MTRREQDAIGKIAGFCAGGCAALVLVTLTGLMQHDDEQAAKNAARVIACSQVAEVCRVEVANKFERLDAQARAMVAFDEIRK
jgi:hypothetical protein